jgi:hypothetical protein
VVQAGHEPPGRVLWIGGPHGGTLVAPGGTPEGTAGSGAAAVRFAVAYPKGATALDFGRPSAGPGYDALTRTIGEVLSGDTRHGGALLAPFAVQYLVASPGDVPPVALGRLGEQVDLVREQAGGLLIFRNTQSVAPATLTNPGWAAAASSGSPLAIAELTNDGAVPLSGGGQRYQGTPTGSSFVLLGQQFDSHWRLSRAGTKDAAPQRAFGWAAGFAPVTGSITVHYTAQWIRTLEMLALALFWALALWITRRPAERG